MLRLLAATVLVLSLSQLCVGQQHAAQTVSPYVRKAILTLMEKSARETLGAEDAQSMVNQLVKGWARQYGANANPSQSLEALRAQLTPQEKVLAIRQLREMANGQIRGAAMMQNVPNAGHDLHYSPYRNHIRQMDYYAKLLNAEVALLAGGKYNPPAGPGVGPAPPANAPPIDTTPEKEALDANDSLRKILEGLYQRTPDRPSDGDQKPWEFGPGREPFEADPPFPEIGKHYPLDKKDILPEMQEPEEETPAELPASLDPFDDLEDDGSGFQSPSVSELEEGLQNGSISPGDFETRLKQHNERLGIYDPDNPTVRDQQTIEHIQSLSMDERIDYYDRLQDREKQLHEDYNNGKLTEGKYEEYLTRLDRDKALFADATASGALADPDFDHIDVGEALIDIATLGGRRIGNEIVEEGAERLGAIFARKLDEIPMNQLPEPITYTGQLFHAVPNKYADDAWNISHKNIIADHRYSEPGIGALYSGTTKESVIKELEHYGVDESAVTIATKNVTIDNVLDLTNAETRRKLGVSVEDITGGSYSATQAIGKFANGKYDGILVPSAQQPGATNFVLFPKKGTK